MQQRSAVAVSKTAAEVKHGLVSIAPNEQGAMDRCLLGARRAGTTEAHRCRRPRGGDGGQCATAVPDWARMAPSSTKAPLAAWLVAC
jgi:hypothetical protein